MRSARVFYNGQLAGILSKSGKKYLFTYDTDYLHINGSKPISLTMPMRAASYESEILFPAFTNRLSEGSNKAIQSKLLKIDENDYFSLLLATATNEIIGPVTFKEIHESTGN